MFAVRTTPQFDAWLAGIRDMQTRLRLAARLEQVKRGSLGDHKGEGDGLMALRADFGPGWRMYYVQRGAELILVLGGGSKRGQQRDIAAAKALAATYVIPPEPAP